ncbi:MAG: ACT domain-containing protein, partial [Candidatus Methanomethylophilaceae archaeon]
TTPHLGASTYEAQERVSIEVAEAAIKFLKDGMITNAINAPRGQLDPEVAPFVTLAEYLGIIAQQLNGSKPVEMLEVTCCGELSKKDTRRIGISAIIGVLQNIIGEKANMINAGSIAKGKGIVIKEAKSEDSKVYDSTLSVKVTSGKKSSEVRGTVFANIPRLVGVNDYSFEIPIQNNIFIARYKDKPGIIGAVGKILGDNGVNIAQMTVGRDAPNGTAIMVLSVDHPVSQEIEDKVDATAGFEKSKFISLL